MNTAPPHPTRLGAGRRGSPRAAGRVGESGARAAAPRGGVAHGGAKAAVWGRKRGAEAQERRRRNV